MTNKRKQNGFLPLRLKDTLILIAVLVLVVGIFLVSKNQGSTITGHVTATDPEQSSTVSASAALISEGDVTVWQGQYFKGTEFQVGTFDFNFTV